MAFHFDAGARGVIVLAAGGTAGHLFPAQALGEELVRRGYLIHLMTDERAKKFDEKFPTVQTYEIPSATINKSKPLSIVTGGIKLVRGFLESRKILKSLKPLAVVGFGGYPTFPPLMAASFAGIPTCIHEANAIMGRANKAIAKRVTGIATSFPKVASVPDGCQEKVVMTGNPVRESVLTAADDPYVPPVPNAPFKVLIFGGSQGAQIFSEIIPQALLSLPRNIRRQLKVTQQVRAEDQDSVEKTYKEAGVTAEIAPFFANLPVRIASSHLVISRSGASTVSELSVIGRPSILVPFAFALDSDQLLNAKQFASAGAGWIIEQEDLTPDRLSALITKLRFSEHELIAASEAGKAMGNGDAAVRLADLVEKLALESALKDAGFGGAADDNTVGQDEL